MEDLTEIGWRYLRQRKLLEPRLEGVGKSLKSWEVMERRLESSAKAWKAVERNLSFLPLEGTGEPWQVLSGGWGGDTTAGLCFSRTILQPGYPGEVEAGVMDGRKKDMTGAAERGGQEETGSE